MQGELGVSVDDSVTGIVSALEADDVIVVGSKQVRDLAFALVAPLGPN